MSFNKNKNSIKPGLLLLITSLFSTLPGFAAGPVKQSVMENSLAITLVIIASLLLLAIGMLAYVVMGAADVFLEKIKEKKTTGSSSAKVLMVLGLVVLATSVFAQSAGAEAVPVITTIGGMSAAAFYILSGVIALEIIIIMVLVNFLRVFIVKEQEKVKVEVAINKEAWWLTWWNKMNSLKPIQEEGDLMLDHDYDGIKELDNKLPPWWLYGFYLTIIVSVIYMYRYHVAHSAPLPAEEYAMAMEKAAIEKEEFLKNSKNNVDENTVTLLTDATELAEGKGLFISQCAACHGPDGQGLVGPNLTDDYWLHKGSVKDIFKIIKYGVAEKGMKSWKEDFSPIQIARISSYIKTLRGTKPANPKEPQGDIFSDDASASADSTQVSTIK